MFFRQVVVTARRAAGDQKSAVAVAGVAGLEAERFALSRGRAERLLAVASVLRRRAARTGSWGWFALLLSVSFLAPWVEELFFRGLLLPRMRKVFGRIDWVVNGAMFGLYHLHQP